MKPSRSVHKFRTQWGVFYKKPIALPAIQVQSPSLFGFWELKEHVWGKRITRFPKIPCISLLPLLNKQYFLAAALALMFPPQHLQPLLLNPSPDWFTNSAIVCKPTARVIDIKIQKVGCVHQRRQIHCSVNAPECYCLIFLLMHIVANITAHLSLLIVHTLCFHIMLYICPFFVLLLSANWTFYYFYH